MTEQTAGKSAIRVERFSDLKFVPRFEYGDMAEIAVTCGEKDGTALGTGFVRLKTARIPWTIKYDEVLTVFEGQLILHSNGQEHRLNPRDAIWLPTGTELVYEAEQALIHFAILPSNWHEAI